MYQLLLDDSLSALATLDDGSVDMVLADLPYGTTMNPWDSVIPLDELWWEYQRVLKPNAPVVLFAQTPFDKVLGASNLSWLKYEWIWVKSRATGHLNANRAPLKAHENILVFSSGGALNYFPQGLEERDEPHIRVGCDNGSNYNKSAKDSVSTFTDYPRSVLRYPSVVKPVHPTEKPVPLLVYLLETYSKPNQLVLDNTMGSGTTGIACAITGRRFIGIDNHPEYHSIATERVSSAYANMGKPRLRE